jgi:hypothetical protein
MRQGFFGHRVLRLVIAMVILHVSTAAPAQVAPMQSRDVEESLQRVRALVRAGEHEAAVEAAREAKAAVEAGPRDPAQLEQAYLLLILAYVNYGNYQANERRPMSAEILHKEAAAQIHACLSIPALRYTEPDRSSGEYPPVMIEMFDRVRAEMFGALRILSLDPQDARAMLDGDALGFLPGEQRLGDAAIPVGPHTLVLERDGYKTLTDTLTISPNSWQERTYRLEKKRGKGFYAWVGAGTVAVVGGLVALVASGSSGDSGTTPTPLPGPPPPPAR